MDTERELTWLRRVHELSSRLAAEHDTAALIPRVLDAAIELTEAELKRREGNKAQTARQLGVPRSTLYSLLERDGLS